MNVYSTGERAEAKTLGAKVITTRWVDPNKGDDHTLDYRSILVGREIKIDQRPELFVATPPFESLRRVIAICASNQSCDEPFHILSSDMKRAYHFA